MDWLFSIDPIKYINELGLKNGLFVLFFIGSHIWIYYLYLGRVKDAKEQIDRLAIENREYRERFLGMLDIEFNYKKLSENSPRQDKE